MQQLPQLSERADGLASTNITNEIARALMGLSPTMYSGPVGSAAPWAVHPSLGVIVDAGPASEVDYADERYWVKEVYVSATAEEDPAGNLTLAEKTETSLIGESEPIIHTVSNLAEKAAGSHLLPVDGTRYVIFWPEEDIRAGVSGLTRWIMDVGAGGMQAVWVYKDGGAAGSSTADCTWTYTLKNPVSGAVLVSADGSDATGKTPATSRYANCEYDLPADGSPGMAYRDPAGTWQLYSVAQEKPKGDRIDVIIGWQVNTVTNSIEYKTQTLLVLEAEEESGWTVAHIGTNCEEA